MRGDPGRAWVEEAPGSRDTLQTGDIVNQRGRLHDLPSVPSIHLETSTSVDPPARVICSSEGAIVGRQFSCVASGLPTHCDGAAASDTSESSPASAPPKDPAFSPSTPGRTGVLASPLGKHSCSRLTALGIAVKAALSAETAATAEPISASEPPSVSPKRMGNAGSQERRHSVRCRDALSDQTPQRVTETSRRPRTREGSFLCEPEAEQCVQDGCEGNSNVENPPPGLRHLRVLGSARGKETACNGDLKEHRMQLPRTTGEQREGKPAFFDGTATESMDPGEGTSQEACRARDTGAPSGAGSKSKHNELLQMAAALSPLDTVARGPSVRSGLTVGKPQETDCRLSNQWQPGKEVAEPGAAESGSHLQQAAFLLQMHEQLQQLLRTCSRPAGPSNTQLSTGPYQNGSEVSSAPDSLALPESLRFSEGKNEEGAVEHDRAHSTEALLGAGVPDVIQSRTTTTSTSGTASEGSEAVGATGLPVLLQAGALVGSLPAQHVPAEVSAGPQEEPKTLPTTPQSDRRLVSHQRTQPVVVLQLPGVEPCPAAMHLLASGVSKEELQRRERELQQQLRSYQQQQEILRVLLGQMTALRQNAEAAEAANAGREGGGVCRPTDSRAAETRSLKRVKAYGHSLDLSSSDNRHASVTADSGTDAGGECRSRGGDGLADCMGWKEMVLEEKQCDVQGPKRRRTEGDQGFLEVRTRDSSSAKSSLVCYNVTGQDDLQNAIPVGAVSIASALNALSLVTGGAKVNSDLVAANVNGLGTEQSKNSTALFRQAPVPASDARLLSAAGSVARDGVEKATTLLATNGIGFPEADDGQRAGLRTELSLPVGGNAWSRSDQEMFALLAGSARSGGRNSLLPQHQQRAAEYARLARLLPRINRLTFSTQTLMWVVRVQTRRTRLCKSFSVRKMGFLPARQAAVDFLAEFDRQEHERQQEQPPSPTAPRTTVFSTGSGRLNGCLESVSQECSEVGFKKEADTFASLCACCGKQRLVSPAHRDVPDDVEASTEAMRSARGLSEPCRPGRLPECRLTTGTRSKSLEDSRRRRTTDEQERASVSKSVAEDSNGQPLARSSCRDTSPKVRCAGISNPKWSETSGLRRRRTAPSSTSPSADSGACVSCATKRNSSPVICERRKQAGTEDEVPAMQTTAGICECGIQACSASGSNAPEGESKILEDEGTSRAVRKAGNAESKDPKGMDKSCVGATSGCANAALSSAGCCCPRSGRSEQADGPEPSPAALRDGREANLQHFHQRQQQHERRKHAREDLAVRARQLPHTVGVKFDPTCPRWIAHWKREGQRFFKSFSVEKNGFENAWQLAKLCRKRNAELAAAATVNSTNTVTSTGSRRRSSHSSSARSSAPQRRVLSRVGTDLVSSVVSAGVVENDTKAPGDVLPTLASPPSGLQGRDGESAQLGPPIPQTASVGDSVRDTGTVFSCVGTDASIEQRSNETVWRHAQDGASLPLGSSASGSLSEAEATVSFLARTAGLDSASTLGDSAKLNPVTVTAAEVAGLRAFCSLVAGDVARNFPVTGHVVSNVVDTGCPSSATAPRGAAPAEHLPSSAAAAGLSCSVGSPMTGDDSLLSALLACQAAVSHSLADTSVDGSVGNSALASKASAAGHCGSSGVDDDSLSPLGCTEEISPGCQDSPSAVGTSGPGRDCGSEGDSSAEGETAQDELLNPARKLGRGRSLSVPARPCTPLEGQPSSREAAAVLLTLRGGGPSDCGVTGTGSGTLVGTKEAAPDELHSKENVHLQQLPQSDQLEKAMRLCSAMMRQQKELGHDPAAETEARRETRSHPSMVRSPRIVEQFTQLPPGFSLPPADSSEGLVTSSLLLLLAQQQQAPTGGGWNVVTGASSPASPAAYPTAADSRRQDERVHSGAEGGLPGTPFLSTDCETASQGLPLIPVPPGHSSADHTVLGSGKSEGTVSSDSQGVSDIDRAAGIVSGGASKLCSFSPSELLMLTSQLSAMNVLCAPHKQKLVPGAGDLTDETGWTFLENQGNASGDHSVPVTPSSVSGACPSVETPTISSARTSAGTCPESGGTSKCCVQEHAGAFRPEAATDIVKLRREPDDLTGRSTDEQRQADAGKGTVERHGSGTRELLGTDNGSSDKRDSEGNSGVVSWAERSVAERALSSAFRRAVDEETQKCGAARVPESSSCNSKAGDVPSNQQESKGGAGESSSKEDGERLTFAKMALSMILRNMRDVCLDAWRRTLQLSVEEPRRRLAKYIELVEMCDSEIPEVRALLVTFSNLIAEQRLPSALSVEAQRSLLADIYTAVAAEPGSDDSVTQHVYPSADLHRHQVNQFSACSESVVEGLALKR